MKKLLLSAILLSTFLSAMPYTKYHPLKNKKQKIEIQPSVDIRSDKDRDVFGIDFTGKFKKRISKNMWAGVYGKYSPNFAKINYPVGFGVVMSVSNRLEESETDIKMGLEKNVKNKYVGKISLAGYQSVKENLSLGGEVGFNTDLILEVRLFANYSFSW